MYNTMKRLIEDSKRGTIAPDEYNQLKAKHLKYLDAYKKGGRITASQYDDLRALLDNEQNK